MKKLLLCVGLVVLFASSTWAAPVGPGGRIYFTKWASGGSVYDNQLYLMRIDVDTSWTLTAGGANNVMSQVTSDSTGDPNQRTYEDMISPEIYRPRANADGTATGDDGVVFLAHCPITFTEYQFTLVTPTGISSATQSTMFADNDLYYTSRSGLVVDVGGDATGEPRGIYVGGDGSGRGVWNDVDGNDSLMDDCDTYVSNGWRTAQCADLEVGSKPDDDDDDPKCTVWSATGTTVYTKDYTGDGTSHSWSSYDDPGGSNDSFYKASRVPDADKTNFGEGIAVGDTDGDGTPDLYWVDSDDQIWRMADLSGNDYFDNSDIDLMRVIYNDDTLDEAWNNVGGGDVELIRDPATGKWTLLVLDGGSSWSGIDGKIFAVELADNGDYAGTSDGVVVIATGIETGYRTDPARLGYSYEDIEFDADLIPEPGTLLLIGTGLLGLVGYIRRRRMT